IYVSGPNGVQLPLSSFARFTSKVESLSISHQGQFPAVTLSFNLAPCYSIGQAVERIQALQRELKLPPTVDGGNFSSRCNEIAADGRWRLHGHGASLPSLAVVDAAAFSGCDPRRLHRAGRALRELHPPDHD